MSSKPFDTLFGYTHDGTAVNVSYKDRQAGTSIIGLPGQGKSGLLVGLASQDIMDDRSVVMIDPHGDTIDKILGELPYELLPELVKKIHLIDFTNPHYVPGLNLFNMSDPYRSVDRVMHVFEVIWPDISSQLYLPLTLRMATLALLQNKGCTLVSMYRFLDDANYRWMLLDKVYGQSVKQFWQSFDNRSTAKKNQQLMPLKNRLGLLFSGRPLIQAVVGSKDTTIDFRKVVDSRDKLLIKLPMRTMPQDAKTIGTILIGLLYDAVFLYSDQTEDKRPGFSLFIDEFQTIGSKDLEVLIKEGRKFGARVTVAHQDLGTLSDSLQRAIHACHTKVSFRLNKEDSSTMASYYADMNPRVRPDDLELHPSKYLMEHDTGIKVISTFVDFYLRQLYRQSGSGRVEVQKTGFRFEHIPSWVLNVEPSNEKPKEYNPIPDLDKLLRDVMRSGNPNLPIPETVVRGFVNCGKGFWWDWRYQMPWTKSKLLSPYIEFPRHLVSVQNGMSYWTRLPENGQEQMYHFFYHLRQLMAYVAVNPLGKRTFTPHSEIARLLTQMPFRIAYMRSGDMVNIIKTEDALPMCDEEFVEARTLQIKVQAIQKYCTVVAQSQVANPDSAPNQPPVSRWEDVR